MPVLRIEGLEVKREEPLARYTSARIGGPAEWFVVAQTVPALVAAVRGARRAGLDCRVLGSGSNVLVADGGVPGLVIVNKTRQVEFRPDYRVYAESGVSLSSLARNCLRRGWAGLEWAVSVPGSVGGAVVGNAGAHGGDMAGNLEAALILERDGTMAEWRTAQLGYAYRESVLKRAGPGESPVVLGATLALAAGDPEELSQRAEAFLARRRATQPPGASMGSMFKNPPADYAGRLIEAAGLKGMRIGSAQISPLHANFFVNAGGATAADVKALIDAAHDRVLERFGVALELEIELMGRWN
jgi:UDP-N-acetylmuramate dehydrogenase